MYSSAEGVYNVTLAVFSGRPHPKWTVASSIIPIQNVISYDLEDMPPKLGYRGFIVQGAKKVRLIVGPETIKLQLKLLETMPSNLLPSGLVKEIQSKITSGVVKPVTSSVRTKRAAPPYQPGQWQGGFHVHRRLCNNCYNYANNRVTNDFAQPGYNKAYQHQPGLTYGQNIRRKAHLDGLTDVPNVPPHGVPVDPGPGDNRHVVALVARSG